jgi:hypothetical protein
MRGGFTSSGKSIDELVKFGQFFLSFFSTMPSFAEAIASPESAVSLKRDADPGIYYPNMLF